MVRDLVVSHDAQLPKEPGLWLMHDWYRAQRRRATLGDAEALGYFATCLGELIDNAHFMLDDGEIVRGRPPGALQASGPSFMRIAHGALRASKVLLKCVLLACRPRYRKYLATRRTTLDDLCLELGWLSSAGPPKARRQ